MDKPFHLRLVQSLFLQTFSSLIQFSSLIPFFPNSMVCLFYISRFFFEILGVASEFPTYIRYWCIVLLVESSRSC